jgi:hypothetical protein
MRTKTKNKINAVAPRLSDEDIDPIEQDDSENVTIPSNDGWLPWDPEDISDIRRLVTESMPEKQRLIIESFLDGLSYADIYVTEKYWRYHFVKGIEFLKKELKV